MGILIEQLSEVLGPRITGADVSQPVDHETWSQILNAFHRHQLLLFRNQTFTPEQHIAFSRRFGDLEIHVCEPYLLPEYPEILLLTNERNEAGQRPEYRRRRIRLALRSLHLEKAQPGFLA